MTLRGNPSLVGTLISLKAMIRTLRKEGGGFMVDLYMLEGECVKDRLEGGEPTFVLDSLAGV